MDVVFIKGLKAHSVIGCYDWERDIRQALLIDVELRGDYRRAATSDALDDALDYASITKRIIALCEQARFQLLEALAEHLADQLLGENLIIGLRLTIKKPGALQEAESAGVIIDRGIG